MSKIIGKQLRIGGSGGINYISNTDIETNAQGYNTYNDGGAVPTDGTGGTSGLNVAQSSSSPLHGSYSLLITKDAANRQGEGVSVDFTIDSADQGKVLTVDMDFSSSGAFSPSDVTFYIYNITDAALIQLAPYQITALKGRFVGTFQSSVTSVSYRLICHVASTNAAAYTFKLDRVSVGPTNVVQGTPVTDWAPYTPTFSAGFGTVAQVFMYYRRVGDTLQIKGSFQSGTIASSIGTFTLPSGLNIDTTKVGRAYVDQLGFGWRHTSPTSDLTTGTASVEHAWFYNGTTSVVQVGRQTVSGAFNNEVVTAMMGSGENLTVGLITIPIAGWSSNVAMSSDAGDNRQVYAQVGLTNSTALTANTVIKYDTVLTDSHASYSTSTGLYTAPVTGTYTFAIVSEVSGTTSNIYLQKNGSVNVTYLHTSDSGFVRNGSVDVYLKAGDTVGIISGATTTAAAPDSHGYQNYLSIRKSSGMTTVAASESVSFRYTASSAQTLTANASTTLNFAAKDWDSHGAFNGTTFTAPAAGKYEFAMMLGLGNTGFTGGTALQLYANKNGSGHTMMAYYQAWSGQNYPHINGTAMMNLVAGDTVTFIFTNSNAGALTGSTGSEVWVTGKRIGN